MCIRDRVEGDIHDIGKNLVVLMLKNYGYNVIDMGKDAVSYTHLDVYKRQRLIMQRHMIPMRAMSLRVLTVI